MRQTAFRDSFFSESKLSSELDEPWISGLTDHAKLRPRADVTIRVIELRVIQEVEELRPEFKAVALFERNSLNDCEIPVVNWRTAEHIVSGVPKLARRLGL